MRTTPRNLDGATVLSVVSLGGKRMARFSMQEARQLEQNLAHIYDFARFVDAKACELLHFEADGTVRR